jgi:soluble lytic murein transglycosylase-like protein
MKIKLITVAILSAVLFSNLFLPEAKLNNENNSILGTSHVSEPVHSRPSIQMYFYIKKFSKQFSIPEPYAFSLAYQETGYQGPLHLDYNPTQTSFAGALGPMQIMPATAELILGRKISKKRLLSDLRLNVYVSMKLLRRLHNRYQNWGLVFGAYNTGTPCVNKYAKNILEKQFKWIKI